MRLFKTFSAIVLLIGVFASCTLQEDPGPIQYSEQLYDVTDFDRLDIGDAMFVTVVRGTGFSISAKGDRRNLNDLIVTRQGNTLTARFSENRNRRHTTYIMITMPSLVSANFYGATTATISSFETEEFLLNLSGASMTQLDVTAERSTFNVSGASNLSLSGISKHVTADISGASLFKGYNMDTEDINIIVSGASHGYVRASKTLVAEATGASSILYRGDAVVTSKVSGTSSIMKD